MLQQFPVKILNISRLQPLSSSCSVDSYTSFTAVQWHNKTDFQTPNTIPSMPCPHDMVSRSFRYFSWVNSAPTDCTFARCPTASINSIPGTLCNSAEGSVYAHTWSRSVWERSNCTTPKAGTRIWLELQDELVTTLWEFLFFLKEDWTKVRNPSGAKIYHTPYHFPHQM